MEEEYFMILVPDTSVLIDGRITSMIKAGEYKGATIIVPEAVIAGSKPRQIMGAR